MTVGMGGSNFCAAYSRYPGRVLVAHWVQHTLCYAWIYSIHTYFTERTKPGCLRLSAKLLVLVSYSAGSLGTRLRERLLGDLFRSDFQSSNLIGRN